MKNFLYNEKADSSDLSQLHHLRLKINVHEQKSLSILPKTLTISSMCYFTKTLGVQFPFGVFVLPEASQTTQAVAEVPP